MVFCYGAFFFATVSATLLGICYGFLLLSMKKGKLLWFSTMVFLLLSMISATVFLCSATAMVAISCSRCYLLWLFATVLQSLLEWLELLDLYVLGLSYSLTVLTMSRISWNICVGLVLLSMNYYWLWLAICPCSMICAHFYASAHELLSVALICYFPWIAICPCSMICAHFHATVHELLFVALICSCPWNDMHIGFAIAICYLLLVQTPEYTPVDNMAEVSKGNTRLVVTSEEIFIWGCWVP